MRKWLIAILISLSTIFNAGSSYSNIEDNTEITKEITSYLEWMSITEVGYSYIKDNFGIKAEVLPNKLPLDLNGFSRISDYYGVREKHPIFGYRTFHYGIDFAGHRGTPVLAAGDGVIEKTAYSAGYGRFIIVNHGNDIKTMYSHLRKITAKKGQRVKAGDQIAELGSTGNSTGPHLHFEVRIKGKKVDPLKLICTEDQPTEDYVINQYQKVNKNERTHYTGSRKLNKRPRKPRRSC